MLEASWLYLLCPKPVYLNFRLLAAQKPEGFRQGCRRITSRCIYKLDRSSGGYLSQLWLLPQPLCWWGGTVWNLRCFPDQLDVSFPFVQSRSTTQTPAWSCCCQLCIPPSVLSPLCHSWLDLFGRNCKFSCYGSPFAEFADLLALTSDYVTLFHWLQARSCLRSRMNWIG